MSSTRSVSPGARLLRSSRMFSMPNPLPSAKTDMAMAMANNSKTSTAAHPTRLAVATPYPSRMTGDWGFKRPFPLKSTTKQTNPVVRINQVDSIEHVTDFSSASDHTMNMNKFHEMNLPMSVPADTRTTHPKSVFEDDRDFTAIKPGTEEELESRRWRFEGPWLAGMLEGEFEEYLSRKVRGRREEFRAFLRQRMAAEKTSAQERKVREETPEAALPAPVDPESISDAQLAEYITVLRQNDRVVLFKLIGRFLDLAPVSLENMALRKLRNFQPNVEVPLTDSGPYAATGPPATHPSAGLSYLRTRKFLENHPIYGPQREFLPVKSRVLKPKNAKTNSFQASLGVGGFVPTSVLGDTTFNQSKTSQRMKNEVSALYELELAGKGGAKMFVVPTMASVNSAGRVMVTITSSAPEADVVRQEMLGEEDIYEEVTRKAAGPAVPMNPRVARGNSGFPREPSAASAQDYGIMD